MRRRILILLASLILAAVSGLAVLTYARTVNQQAINGKEGVWVLLATERIPARTTAATIRRDKLAERVLMPSMSVPDGALGTLDPSLDALLLNVDLAPRQLLLRAQFDAADDSAGGMGVPAGMLAVTVELTIAPQVAGNLTAGDQVTVFDTYPAVPKPEEKQVTRILLPRATVVSVGAKTAAATGGALAAAGAGGQQSLVTFAVDQGDAERLVHASRTGLLYLGLLHDETRITPGPGVDNDRLFS